jgi:hypothetical protein
MSIFNQLNVFQRVLFSGAMVLAFPASIGSTAEIQTDPRVVRLQEFLEEKQCPVRDLAPDFVAAADQHQLDWRLLPSISFVESTGGKYQKNNNVFGWANGHKRFPTVRHGIYTVARHLGKSSRYRRKSTDGILETYNPRPEYKKRIQQVMAQIGPRQL